MAATSAAPGLAWPGFTRPGDPGGAAGPGPVIINAWPIVASNTYGTQVTRISNSTGNALIAVVGCGSNSQQVLPRFNVADDAHNYWQYAGSSPLFSAGQSRRSDIWIAANASAASMVSVAESWFTSGVAGYILEVQGFPTWAQVDFVVTGSGAGTSATLTGTATGTDYIVGGLVTSAPGVPVFTTTPASFSVQPVVGPLSSSADQTSVSLGVASGQFAAGSVPAAWTWAGTSDWAGVLVGFSMSPVRPLQQNPNWPLMKFEMALGWQPGNLTGIMPAWTDITNRVLDEQGQASFYAGRGRDYELTQPAAGQLRMRLDNHDGAFDPANVPAANVAWNGNGSVNPQVENGTAKQPVTPNATYGIIAHMWQSAAWAAGCQLRLQWFTSGGSFISARTIVAPGTTTPTLVTISGQAPSNAAQMDVSFIGQGTPPAGITFFAAATSVNPFYPGTTLLTAPQSSIWGTGTGATVQSQNGWTPSAPYYPYVNPETPVRVTGTWVSTGQIFPVAGAYTDKLPQSFDYPQWGMTQYEGSDGIGLSSQITLPSALGGDILIDGPYAYFPLSEFYSTAGGAQFSNASRTNLRPAYGVDDTDRGGGFPLQTGQSLNLPGDPGTGIGITGVPSPGTTVIKTGAAGAYYRDPGMPQMNPAFAVEFECAVNAQPADLSATADVIRLIGYPNNYVDITGSGTLQDGTRLIVTLSRSNTSGFSMRATLIGFAGSGVTATSAANLIPDTGTHDYAVTVSFDGTTWHLTCYIDGTSVATGTTTGVDPGVFTSILAMGPAVLGGGERLVANYTLGHVAMYGFALDPNRITSHATTGRTAGVTQFITGRYARLHAWSGAQLPKAVTYISPGPLAGNADQIQGTALSDAAYSLSQYEGGMYYCDAQFNNWYVARAWFYNRTAKWTFSDQPGQGTPYLTDTGFDYSNTFLWNITQSQRVISSSNQVFVGAQNPGQVAVGTFNSFGATANVADLASEQQYLPRGPLSQQVETSSDQDAYDRANWSLAKYRVPVLRPNQIIIDPASNPSAWPVALGVEQGDIVSLSRTPLPAVQISCLAIVQKVEHRGGPSRWQTVLTLAPYFPENAVMQLDNSPFNTPASGAMPW